MWAAPADYYWSRPGAVAAPSPAGDAFNPDAVTEYYYYWSRAVSSAPPPPPVSSARDKHDADLEAYYFWSRRPVSAPPPPPDIQPVSWWHGRYDTAWTVSQYNAYQPLSVSGDAWDIYNIAYALDGPVAMYLAVGDTKYLDQVLEFVNNIIGTAKVSSSISTSQFKDSYLTWVNHSNPQVGDDGLEYPLYESYGWRYIMRLLWVIKQNPAVYADPTYKAQYDSILAFTEINIFDKWYLRSATNNIYRSRTHMACHWAMICMYMPWLTTDSTRASRAVTIQDNINNHLPNYPGSSLHGQMVTNSGAYFWSDVWGSFAHPGQDVSHGNGVLAYIIEAAAMGQGGWTTADLTKFGVTFSQIIWPATTTYGAYVDGTGTGNGWFPDGFTKLGRFDPVLQKRLEVHPVAPGVQTLGNGALNAATLLAP